MQNDGFIDTARLRKLGWGCSPWLKMCCNGDGKSLNDCVECSNTNVVCNDNSLLYGVFQADKGDSCDKNNCNPTKISCEYEHDFKDYSKPLTQNPIDKMFLK